MPAVLAPAVGCCSYRALYKVQEFTNSPSNKVQKCLPDEDEDTYPVDTPCRIMLLTKRGKSEENPPWASKTEIKINDYASKIMAIYSSIIHPFCLA